MIAAMSATFATLLTSPADCVKTRMQVNPNEHPTLRKAIQRIYAVSRCAIPDEPVLAVATGLEELYESERDGG